MLDIKFIRENPDAVKKAVTAKHLSELVDVDKIVNLDKEYLNILRNVETYRNLRNEYSNDISRFLGKEREALIEKAKVVKMDIVKLEKEMEVVRTKLDEKLLLVPNVISPEVPEGKDASENVVLREWSKPTRFKFQPKDHMELGKALDLIDMEKASEISGSRFCYLKNEAVLLQFAIVHFIFNTLTDPKIVAKIAKSVGNPFTKTFTPVLPPVLIKPEIMKKMDRLDPIEERYYIPGDPLVLVGSAEHTLGPLLMGETVAFEDLPIRYIGYSSAFRREAGSYGKDIKGILRVHQFDKLEFETFVSEEYGEVEQKFLVALQEYFVQQLGIPYQVIAICAGDTGKPDYKQIDVNCWMPSHNNYCETHTSDYMTDFQSRRLNSAYKTEKGEKKFLYMNDATAMAIGRILIAIFENYQQEDGSIKIPKVLQKYLGMEKIMRKAYYSTNAYF
jgi:seryl-tRNA synthetase